MVAQSLLFFTRHFDGMYACMHVCVCAYVCMYVRVHVTVCQQLNAWAIYNWENGTSMCQKLFQLEVARGLLKECEPAHPLCTPTILPAGEDEEGDSEDLLTPSATKVTPAARFVCKKEHMASISKSKKYK